MARREDRLRTLAAELSDRFDIRAEAIGADLGSATARADLVRRIDELGLQVEVLVNNAGFGGGEDFADTDREQLTSMVELNCVALLDLQSAYLPRVVGAGGVPSSTSSTAALQPLPGSATYAATKAFVLSLSEAVHGGAQGHRRDADRGLPRAGQDEVMDVAGLSGAEDQLPGMFWLSAESVAKAAVEAADDGKRAIVPGLLNRAGAITGRRARACSRCRSPSGSGAGRSRCPPAAPGRSATPPRVLQLRRDLPVPGRRWRKGGRSTHGVCMGALSWEIEDGEAEDVSLAGLRAVMALKYDDDEAGSPWDYVLFVDDRADPDQRRLLEAIFLGQLGGTPEQQFPWVFKPSRPIGTRVVADRARPLGEARVVPGGEGGHRPRRRAGHRSGAGHVRDPGHHRSGHELHSDSVEVDADGDALGFRFEEVCAYWSTFSYSSDD